MDTVHDFEDFLGLLGQFQVRYLIIGGLAFTYHAKPRYTKDMGLWIGPDRPNVSRANQALAAFGSPYLLDPDRPDEILQLGVEPNRIDLLREPNGLGFDEAWPRRQQSRYGQAVAYWIDLDSFITLKSQIDHPRHQEDARVLREVRARRDSES